MRTRSLARRILVIASIAIVCAFLGFAVVVDQRQRALVKADVDNTLLVEGGLAARAVADWLGGRVLLTQQVAVAVARTPAQPLAALQGDVLTTQFQSTYFGDTAGVFTIWPKAEMPAGYDPRARF